MTPLVGRRTGQDGYMLVATLALLGVVSIMAAVLLTMTVTASKVSAGQRDDAVDVSAVDSALERVVNALRKPGTEGVDCHGASANGPAHPRSYQRQISLADGQQIDVIVDCESHGSLTPARDVSLRAFVGDGNAPVGAARVKITDRIGTESRPGIELTVCDWQLGQVTAGPLTACG